MRAEKIEPAVLARGDPGFHYLIFPPWAQYRFAWKDLPHLFASPNDYGLDRELEGLVKLGYTVKESDHEFVTGPFGGGIIVVKRDMQRWFPAALLRTECQFRTPPGFGRVHPFRCFVLVPRITTEQKLGLIPIPLAPSPFFSVEQVVAVPYACQIAYGFVRELSPRDANIPTSFPSLKLELDVAGMPHVSCQEAFSLIRSRNLTYVWSMLKSGTVQPPLLIAAVVYLGLEVARRTTSAFKVMHAFSPSYVSGIEYPSARTWNPPSPSLTERTKCPRIASDW